MPPSSSNNYRKAAQPTVADTAGRIAPRDTRLEAAVLGALMLEKDAYTIVCDILHADSFYEPAHQRIYEAIQTLGAAQSPIDMLTVVEQLRLNGTLDSVGGTAYVAQLTMEVASAANVEFHARIVAQKYLSRQLIGFASELETKAFDESIDVDDVLQEAEGKLFEISQRNVKKEVTQIDPVISQAIEAIQTAANRTSGLSGLESGYHDLDKLTSGWQNSDLIIIAARPAMGKTAFVLSMAKNMAVNYNTPVAIFSLEMSNVQLVNRLISNVCEIEGSKIKSGQLTPIEWNQLMGRIKNLTGAPLYIDDTPSLSIFELRTKARRLVREHGVRMIIIDYLQLMNASGMKFGSREQERPAGIGRHRAGRRHGVLHPPPGVLSAQRHRRLGPRHPWPCRVHRGQAPLGRRGRCEDALPRTRGTLRELERGGGGHSSGHARLAPQRRFGRRCACACAGRGAHDRRQRRPLGSALGQRPAAVLSPTGRTCRPQETFQGLLKTKKQHNSWKRLVSSSPAAPAT